MKSLFSFLIWLLPAVAMSQKPFHDYVASNAGKSINTEYDELLPMVLSDGLTLYFSSNRPGGQGDLDIYVCTRKSKEDAWGEPRNLGTNINTKTSDHSVTVSEDGHWMIFTSEKEGSSGIADLYISFREDVSNSMGWGEAKNAGMTVNSSKIDACSIFHKEGKAEKLYFVSDRSGGLGKYDLYVCSFNNGKFTKPVLLKGVNSHGAEMHFEPKYGFIWTDRKGGSGGHDIWITTKRKGNYEWEAPMPLESNINTPSNEGLPSITDDKSLFVFHSDRPGGEGKADVYFARPSN